MAIVVRKKKKKDQHNIGNMVVVGSGVVMVMTMVKNNKWLLCLRIHTDTHTHTHLDQTLKSLLCHFWNYGFTRLLTSALYWFVYMSDC